MAWPAAMTRQRDKRGGHSLIVIAELKPLISKESMMSSDAVARARIDSDTKKRATAVLKAMGLSAC